MTSSRGKRYRRKESKHTKKDADHLPHSFHFFSFITHQRLCGVTKKIIIYIVPVIVSKISHRHCHLSGGRPFCLIFSSRRNPLLYTFSFGFRFHSHGDPIAEPPDFALDQENCCSAVACIFLADAKLNETLHCKH